MARRPHPISGADSRPRIYLKQVLRDGRTYGWHGSKPPEFCDGHLELTVPLALQHALATVDGEAVIFWLGREEVL